MSDALADDDFADLGTDLPPGQPSDATGTSQAIDLDPSISRTNKRRRARTLHALHVPLLRAIGMACVVLLVALHQVLVPGSGGNNELATLVALSSMYVVASGIALLLLYDLERRPGLASFFLAGDVLLFMVAIWASGGTHSWLFPLPLLRVADQAPTSFRRVLAFTLLSLGAYLGLALTLDLSGMQDVAWGAEAIKLAVLGGASLHIALTASTAESMRKRTQAAVRVARNLIGELRQQSRELSESRDRARAAVRAKAEFMANMSHEIRTPMNGILGMTELALATEISLEQRELLSTARSSANNLLAIIDDILDYSRLETSSNALDHVELDLRREIARVLRPHADAAQAKGLELSCHIGYDVPEKLRGDPARLGQVLDALLDNAIKFTPRGEVALRVELHALQGDQAVLHVTVKDSGVGFPDEARTRIFDAFTQADGSSTRSFGGTGLGLTITARLVELMGGHIWAHGSPGRGASFHCHLRLEVRDPAGVPSNVEDLAGLRALVVDPHITTRLHLTEQLDAWGLDACEAEGPFDALTLLDEAAGRDEPYDVILLDARMTGVESFERSWRRRFGDVPVVLLTRRSDRDDKAHFARAASRVAKPVMPQDLVAAIRAARSTGALRINTDAGPQKARRVAAARSLNVLLVEDNKVNQKVAQRMLNAWGHTVWLAENGQQALDALGEQPVDIVLMDIQMPVMDGYQATTAIRAREAADGGHQIIIAMTAHAMKGDKERCLEAGMDGYVTKPFRPDDLFAVLEEKARDVDRAPAR